jgi:hypothetical protein
LPASAISLPFPQGDGEPGVMTIWRGLTKVHVGVKMMQALGAEKEKT